MDSISYVYSVYIYIYIQDDSKRWTQFRTSIVSIYIYVYRVIKKDGLNFVRL